MGDSRTRRLVAGSALALLVAAAPELAPYSPDASPDPAAARHRPPGTALRPLRLADGRTWLLDAARPVPGGGLVVVRRGVEHRFEATAGRLGRASVVRFALGSDHLGRDVASRILHGLRNSLAIALGGALLALVAGTLIGAAAGLGGRRLDAWIRHGIDVAAAVPKLFVVLAVAAAATPGPATLLALLAALTWMPTARLVRGELLVLEASDFAAAARATGCSSRRILLRHHLPHLAPALGAQTALAGAELVLLEATLSFLGAGLPPPAASLGGMLAEAMARPIAPWWTLFFPGAAVGVAALLLGATAGAWGPEGLGAGQRSRSHRGPAASR